MKIEKLKLGNFTEAAKNNAVNLETPKNFKFFGQKEEVTEPAEFTRAQLNENLKQHAEQAFQEGYNKGKEEVIKHALALEETTKKSVENLTADLTSFLEKYTEQKKNYMRDMTRVTMMAIQKIAAKTIKENTEEVILQALEKASNVLSKHPEIIFKTKKNVLEKIQHKVENILKDADFKGKVIYIYDETVPDGNCIIEWGESGISINSEETVKEIDEILSEYLKSI